MTNKDSAKDYYNRINPKFKENDTYRACTGLSHYLINGVMSSTVRKSRRTIKGLWPACKKAKRMARYLDFWTPHEEGVGIVFWVEKTKEE